MTTPDALATLTERLTRLEARVERLTRAVRAYVDLTDRRDHIATQERRDAFERLINLELHVFPHLAEDIRGLHGIIGDYHDKADQPLDRRTP